MHLRPLNIQKGKDENAEAISALAIQVFLDTYATEGVRYDLAKEAFSEYSSDCFLERLQDSNRKFLLAFFKGGLIGFSEFLLKSSFSEKNNGSELVRLYVQPRYQQQGLGKMLLKQTEDAIFSIGGSQLWLTAWEENQRAIAFYEANGYKFFGNSNYEFQGNIYRNKVFSKHVHS